MSGAPLRFEVDPNQVGWIRFNDPERKVNVLTLEVMKLLEDLADVLKDRHDLTGLVFASDKPGCFLAGADLELIRNVATPAEGAALARRGQKMFNAFADLKIPTAVLIDGVCLGGGLELAMTCDWILASDSAKTKLGLPEVQLGILPGLGGTQRMPRRVDLSTALDLILSGRQLDGRRAEKASLIDECCPAELLGERVHRWLKKGKRDRPAPKAWMRFLPVRRTIFHLAAKKIARQTQGHYPSPLAALSAIERGLAQGLESGLAFEAEAFGSLAAGDVSKNIVRLFFLKEKFAKRPEGCDAGFSRGAVIGAGVMGGGIANLLASKGISVRIKDIAPEALAKALSTAADLNRSLSKRGKEGKLEAQKRMWRISPTLEYTGMADADIVIEAVVENLALKQEVFAQLESHVPAGCLLATNTSSLPITRISGKMKRPERSVGIHFFNPVHRMDLVEVIPGAQTSKATTERAVSFVVAIGKIPVVVKDSPGFLVNRILLPYVTEAARCFADGASVDQIDRALKRFGMPMGPMELADEVGLDVGIKVAHILEEHFGERMAPPDAMSRMETRRWLGKKTGVGFYLYENLRRTLVNPHLAALRPQGRGALDGVLDDGTIADRCVLMMVNEASRCLDEKIVASCEELDLAMVFGTGFAPFRGGLWKYATTRGLGLIRTRLEELAGRFGARFAPAPSLR